MDKVFNQAKDKNVAAVKLYKKEADANYVYADSTGTTKLTAEQLQDAYLKGCVVIDGDNTYIPVKLNVTSGVATITYIVADTTTATTAVLTTLASEEYDPE